MASYCEEVSPRTYIQDMEEERSQRGFIPDESFIELWEQYIADDDLEEEFDAYKRARSRFLGLIRGPCVSTWMRESARWLLAAADAEDEENALNYQLSDHGDSEFPHIIDDDGEEAGGEAPEEEFRDAEPSGREDNTEVSWAEFYAQQDAKVRARYDTDEDQWGASELDLPSQDEVEEKAPDEAEEYIDDYYFGGTQSSADQVEDPPATARQEYESDPFSWGPAYDPPAKAREQYEMPASRAEPVEAASSWSQVVTAAREQLSAQNFVQEQAAAFEAMTGVPMDTSAGRSYLGHRRKGVSFTGEEVCHHCRQVGHTRVTRGMFRLLPTVVVTFVSSITSRTNGGLSFETPD